MTSIARDPLLAIFKAILWFLMIVFAVVMLACIAGIPLALIFQDRIFAELAEAGLTEPGMKFIGAISLLLALIGGMMGAGAYGLLLLKRIVDSVGKGDPFVPINARRLTLMAWLALAAQLLGLFAGGIAIWLSKATEGVREGDVQVDGGLDGNGLLLVLVLFILARVFRKGAEMRAELEGTV